MKKPDRIAPPGLDYNEIGRAVTGLDHLTATDAHDAEEAGAEEEGGGGDGNRIGNAYSRYIYSVKPCDFTLNTKKVMF